MALSVVISRTNVIVIVDQCTSRRVCVILRKLSMITNNIFTIARVRVIVYITIRVKLWFVY